MRGFSFIKVTSHVPSSSENGCLFRVITSFLFALYSLRNFPDSILKEVVLLRASIIWRSGFSPIQALIVLITLSKRKEPSSPTINSPLMILHPLFPCILFSLRSNARNVGSSLTIFFPSTEIIFQLPCRTSVEVV